MQHREVLYLDHAATTPVADEVREAMLPYLTGDFGNPSSTHEVGRRARAAIDSARDILAGALGCAHRELIFTSSATEATNLALRGVVESWSHSRPHLVTTAIEHDCVINTCRALEQAGRVELTVIDPDAGGIVDPEEIASAVRDDTALASVMLANNEVGTIQDVSRVSRLVKARNPKTLVHTDAVQGFGKLAVNVDDLGVDLLTLTAHKIYGPKGIGCLYLRSGTRILPQITGGGQERGRRSGTENVAGIAGFATAAQLVEREREQESARQAGLTERLVDLVTAAVPDAVLTGDPTRRLANFATFAFPRTRTDLLLTILDGRGICVSGGSACSSGAPTPSHVLLSMGLSSHLARGALRCAVGRWTQPEDIERAGVEIVEAVQQVRAGELAGARI
jgi:cysteine desulfurase